VSAVFADTFFFLALLNHDDPVHERAQAEAKLNRPIVTTDFILLELGNACARAEDHADFLSLVDGLRATPRISIVPLTSNLLHRGIELMRNRPDKDWSLTDCISFVVMTELELKDALTRDRHFQQAGFTALFV
jgi:uncharacterized protein